MFGYIGVLIIWIENGAVEVRLSPSALFFVSTTKLKLS